MFLPGFALPPHCYEDKAAPLLMAFSGWHKEGQDHFPHLRFLDDHRLILFFAG